jgi:hypothetical protein
MKEFSGQLIAKGKNGKTGTSRNVYNPKSAKSQVGSFQEVEKTGYLDYN